MTLQEESNVAIAVMKASTKASARAISMGIVPILQFGAIIVLAMLVVALPLKLARRV
jgi:hypothetical protein